MTPLFYLTYYQPSLHHHFDWGVLRRTVWMVQNRDTTFGHFTSWWFFGHLQWYHGTAKCDGSESLKRTYRDAVMLRKNDDRWTVILPANFGAARSVMP